MLSLYELKYLYIASIVKFSPSTSCSCRQLKFHYKISSHPNRSYYHGNSTFLMNFVHSHYQHLFLFSALRYYPLVVLLWTFFLYSCRVSLVNNGPFISSSTNCIRPRRSFFFVCFLLITSTVLLHLSIDPSGNFEMSIHIVSGVFNAFYFCPSDTL